MEAYLVDQNNNISNNTTLDEIESGLNFNLLVDMKIEPSSEQTLIEDDNQDRDKNIIQMTQLQVQADPQSIQLREMQEQQGQLVDDIPLLSNQNSQPHHHHYDDHHHHHQQQQHHHQPQHLQPTQQQNFPKPRGRKKKIRTEPIRPICPQCEKQFSNQSALTKHKLTHSDERKFSCQQCSKAFKRHDHLTGHMQTHSNRKPFNCTIQGCDKTYCDARSLRRHKENIHHIVAPRDLNGNCSSSSSSSTSGSKLCLADSNGLQPIDSTPSMTTNSINATSSTNGVGAPHQPFTTSINAASNQGQNDMANSSFAHHSMPFDTSLGSMTSPHFQQQTHQASDHSHYQANLTNSTNCNGSYSSLSHSHSDISCQPHEIKSQNNHYTDQNHLNHHLNDHQNHFNYAQTPPPATAWPMNSGHTNVMNPHTSHQMSYSAGYATSHHQQFTFDFSHVNSHQQQIHQNRYEYHQPQQPHTNGSPYQPPPPSSLSLNSQSQLLRRRMQRLNSDPGSSFPPVRAQTDLLSIPKQQQQESQSTIYTHHPNTPSNNGSNPTATTASNQIQPQQHINTPPPTAALTNSSSWPLETPNLQQHVQYQSDQPLPSNMDHSAVRPNVGNATYAEGITTANSLAQPRNDLGLSIKHEPIRNHQQQQIHHETNHHLQYVQTPPPTTTSMSTNWTMDQTGYQPHQMSYSAGYTTSQQQQFSFDFNHVNYETSNIQHQAQQPTQNDYVQQSPQEQQVPQQIVSDPPIKIIPSTLTLNSQSHLLRRRMQRLNSDPGGNFPLVENHQAHHNDNQVLSAAPTY